MTVSQSINSAKGGSHLWMNFSEATGHSWQASRSRRALMAAIWETVLCLPKFSAARTMLLEAASSRMPVMANSRATMTMTIQAATLTVALGLTWVLSTKAMKAEQV